jgi:pimeloyl-ACP methyl ester carboxylesterase
MTDVRRKMPTSYLIPTRSGRVAVRDTAGGGDAVVLVHGWGVDSVLNWETSLHELEGTHRVVTVDLPGHGMSRADGEMSIENMAGVIVDVCEHIGGGRTYLCGYSMGGAIVLEAAETAGVDGVVFAATAARFSRWGLGLVAAAGGALKLSGMLVRRGTPTVDNAHLAAVWRLSSNDPRALGEALMQTVAYDGRERADNLDIPAVSLVTVKDHIVDVSLQRELAALARAEVIEIDQGHGACSHKEFGVAMAEAVRRLSMGTREA